MLWLNALRLAGIDRFERLVGENDVVYVPRFAFSVIPSIEKTTYLIEITEGVRQMEWRGALGELRVSSERVVGSACLPFATEGRVIPIRWGSMT